MIHAPHTFERTREHPVDVGDITVVVAVRAHDANPWVPARLALLRGYYAPAPTVRVVDFGSQGEHRAAVERICADAGFDHSYVDDTGTFSLARARNRGAIDASTDLLFFTDVDCFGERDLFARLAAVARAIELGTRMDQILTLPAYHLTAAATARVEAAADPVARSARIAQAFLRAAYARQGDVTELVAPYSNVFLCHRAFFDLTGGFNESFRGHGSEDFEYLLRFAVIAGQFPLPRDAADDRYGPTGIGFFATEKPYRGFRRLFELMAFQAETAGLRIAHLDHTRAGDDAWQRDRDRDRAAFEQQVRPFLTNPSALLGYDWLPRERRVEVGATTSADLDRLLALRVAGYRVQSSANAPAAHELSAEERAIVDACRAMRTPPGDRFDLRSYAAARLALGAANTSGEYGHGIDRPRATGGLGQRARKLAREPGQFLEDSRFPALRWIGRRLGK